MNTERKGIARVFFAAGLWLGAVFVLYGYFGIYRPNQDLRDLWPRMKSEEYVDPAEIRAICHRILSDPVGDHHDAFIMLEGCGDETSIPYLIRALHHESGPSPEGYMVCTTGHCLSALEKLTGQTFGYEPEKWDVWWRNYQQLKKEGQAPPLPKNTPPVFNPKVSAGPIPEPITKSRS